MPSTMGNTRTSEWQFLDVVSVSLKEFAAALNGMEKVVAWCPQMEYSGVFQHWQRTEVSANPSLAVLRFPLQRGYARAPFRWVLPFESRIVKMLRTQSRTPEESPLICVSPFYAPVAERWPGPVIYYLTDLTAAYYGLNSKQVFSLDKRMCRVAQIVCPNSKRIASYLTTDTGCAPHKITVIPNATRESNVQASPRYEPGPLPRDAEDLPRPIAGVLGDLSGNMDWELIQGTIERTPSLSWLFVGPSDRAIQDPKQEAARAWTKKHARFVGMKPYGELQMYARCVDAAVLPYQKREPTYSGSSTRFYEHLAAGRPMVATRGFAELLEKEPLLKLVDTPDEMANALAALRSTGFRDGHESARWEASKVGTWEERARMMRRALEASRMDAVANK